LQGSEWGKINSFLKKLTIGEAIEIYVVNKKEKLKIGWSTNGKTSSEYYGEMLNSILEVVGSLRNLNVDFVQ
jgi:hypothetical protein